MDPMHVIPQSIRDLFFSYVEVQFFWHCGYFVMVKEAIKLKVELVNINTMLEMPSKESAIEDAQIKQQNE